jgi:NAD(P)-dependent dehydrogenase (short-subunit alcohol dehydrogenase family)
MNPPVVLITGALTGIGRATALAFAHEGARVVISGRREEAGNKLAAELRALGAEAEFLPSGVRHEDEVRSLVDKTSRALVVSMWPSITPVLKASPARSRSSPLRATPPPSTPTC